MVGTTNVEMGGKKKNEKKKEVKEVKRIKRRDILSMARLFLSHGIRGVMECLSID